MFTTLSNLIMPKNAEMSSIDSIRQDSNQASGFCLKRYYITDTEVGVCVGYQAIIPRCGCLTSNSTLLVDPVHGGVHLSES